MEFRAAAAGPTADAARVQGGRSPRARALRWIKPLVTIALYAIVFRLANVGAILDHLRTARLEYLAAAVAVYVAGQALSAWRWHLLLAPVRLRTAYRRLLGFYFVGMFFNLFLPTIVGGDAVKALLLARDTGAPARSAISVFMERNLGLFALLAIASAASWWTRDVRLFGAPLTVWTIALFAAFAIANLVSVHPGAHALLDRLMDRTPLAPLRPRTAVIYEAVASYAADPRALAAPLLLSFAFQAMVIGVVFLNARALEYTFPLTVFAVFVPLVSLAGMVPISVNGLGVREALYILLFGRVGAPAELSVSLALLFLAVTFVAALPGGLVYLLQPTPPRAAGPAAAPPR